jgi:hypothetical protein
VEVREEAEHFCSNYEMRLIPNRDNDFDDRIRERMERKQEPVVRLTDEEIARRIAAVKAAPLPRTRRRKKNGR